MRNSVLHIFLVLLLASCSQKGKNLKIDKNIAEGDVHYGGVFSLNEVEKIDHIFPLMSIDMTSRRADNCTFQGLVTFNAANLEIVPCLATDWEMNKEATKYTFHLRDSVFFHDDSCFDGGRGRKVTAHDFKYCIDKSCQDIPLNTMSWVFEDVIKGAREYFNASSEGDIPQEGIEGVKVIDDLTLEIELTQPVVGFVNLLTLPSSWVYPREAFEKYGDDIIHHPVGTGPFKLSHFSSEMILFSRNENYWEKDSIGNQLPYVDGVKITFESKENETKALNEGIIDMLWELPLENLDLIFDDLSSVKSGIGSKYIQQSVNGLSVQWYEFLCDRAEFKNVKVRKAFNYAIDREQIIDFYLQGNKGEAAMNGYVPSIPGYASHEIKGFKYDSILARKLMLEAGYPDGRGFPTITLLANEGSPDIPLVFKGVQKMLKENIGVNVIIKYVPRSVLNQTNYAGKSSITRRGWILDYPDPENFLAMFHSKHVPVDKSEPSPFNSARYVNPEFDKLMDAAMKEKDEGKRMYYLKLADEQLISNPPGLLLYHDSYIRFLQPEVRNFPINSFEFRDLARVYFETEEE